MGVADSVPDAPSDPCPLVLPAECDPPLEWGLDSATRFERRRMSLPRLCCKKTGAPLTHAPPQSLAPGEAPAML